MGRPGATQRAAMALVAVFAIAACERAETANIGSDSPGTAGAAIAATSGGDVTASAAATAETAAAMTDGNVLGFLGMVDNSEIETAKVARARGTSNRVKEFARMMESEHTALLQAGRALAAELTIEVDPPPARELEQMHIEALETLGRQPRGDQFDRVYIAGQVSAHDHVLELLRAAASREQRNARLASHLQSAIATIEQHRDRARGVMDSLSDPADVSAR